MFAMPSEFTQMQIDIGDLKKDVKGINEKVDALHADLKDFIASSQETFAGKWTEKVLIFIGSAIGLALLGALMALLLNHGQ
jgi:hypothetical protein